MGVVTLMWWDVGDAMSELSLLRVEELYEELDDDLLFLLGLDGLLYC